MPPILTASPRLPMVKEKEKREKSRTPQDARRSKPNPENKKETDIVEAHGKEEKQHNIEIEKMDTEKEAKKRLEFTPPAASTEIVTRPTEHEQKRHKSQEMERRSVQFTEPIWSDSESQTSKRRSETAATESEHANSEKTETSQMALATRRMEQLTMSTPERSDGTKTPLRKPGEKRRERSRSRVSEYSVEADEMEDDRPEEKLSAEELQELVLEERTHTRKALTQVKHALKEVEDQVQQNKYDIETHERITAHLLYKRLQEDAKEASLSLCIEGCPRDAEYSDKHTFIKWMLESSGCNDPDVKVSMHNTRGEISNTIVIIFTSGFHRNKSYQWYVDNYIRHKQKLWWWSPSTGTTGKEIRIRKTLSEDARIRGRYLKAAMDCLSDLPSSQNIEFYPSWQENAVKARNGDYLVWCHFNYTDATCQVFVDTSVYSHIQAQMNSKIEALYAASGSKGKGKSKGGMGRGKGVFSTLDVPFDPRDPFWTKYIKVTNWRNDEEVREALRNEEAARQRFETSDG